MTIANMYKKWRIKKLLVKYNDLDQYTFNRIKCIELLNILDHEEFNTYIPKNGMSITIEVRYIDIGVYIDKIVNTISIIKKGNPIPINWDDVNEVKISLDRFFIVDGHYSNVAKNINLFKTHSLKLCELLEDSDILDYGLPEHNKRMLLKLIYNICLITIGLIKININ